MSFDFDVMKEFIDHHPSAYVGKYCFHSGYRVDEKTFKNHYYMFDENFRQIDIFVEISCSDHITYTFSENLHEKEQIFIVKDALKHVIERSQIKTPLPHTLYEEFIQAFPQQDIVLEAINYLDLLNYLKYHKGINQQTMDEFYQMFIPCLKTMIEEKQYQLFMNSVLYLLKGILYEREWKGTNLKYLDTEYQFHLYYIRQIIRMVYQYLDKFYKYASEELFEVIQLLCQNQRFSFAIMTDFGTLVLSHYKVTLDLIHALKEKLVLCQKGEERKDENLVFSYIYYIFKNDYDQYYDVVLKMFRCVVENMLVLANYDLDLALGNWLISSESHQLILDLFDKDYNSYVFTCFPIDTFPEELRLQIREKLVVAIKFFAARMENEKYRLSSFEQVVNLNRLLMDHFKEWYK